MLDIKALRDAARERLPRKVGDTVYGVWSPLCTQFTPEEGRKPYVQEHKIRQIAVTDDGVFIDGGDWTWHADCLGKTLFLTRAEAETAMSGKGE